MPMPNAAETIERLARESERQKVKIEQLEARNVELEAELEALKARQAEEAKQPEQG